MRALVLFSCLLIFFLGWLENSATAADTVCPSQASSVSACHESNDCVTKCGSFNDFLTIISCEQFNTDLCSAVSCCDECFNEIEAYYECTLGTVFGVNCDLECSSAGLRSGLGCIVVLVAAAALAKAV